MKPPIIVVTLTEIRLSRWPKLDQWFQQNQWGIVVGAGLTAGVVALTILILKAKGYL